ncbi:hypothetical protein QTP70_034598 [Hemibagrus guttatus]|uniref:Long-chain-fatty-acid--CoA ligase n=1 Tax=Hemibagrus guttatus TaxID=175788 RepID=A0AAE0VDH3_9TELE|nr:hypothetical protein QTP70_034598 [Hemibagrus guttatus]
MDKGETLERITRLAGVLREKLISLSTPAAHPSTGHAAAAHPSTGHAAAAQPSTGHAAGAHPSTGHAAAAHPSTGHAAAAHPSTGHAAAAQPSTGHAAGAHPSTGHAAAAHPSTGHTALANTLNPCLRGSMYIEKSRGPKGPSGLMFLEIISLGGISDSRHMCIQGVRIAMRMKKFRSSTPCYTILDRFLDVVKNHPEKKFLVFEGRSYTYSEADKLSSKAARALLHHTELQEGDTVALFLGNEPDFVWIWLGLCKLGCTAALLNTNIRSKSLLHCFTCCGAKTLISGAADYEEPVSQLVRVCRTSDGLRALYV